MNDHKNRFGYLNIWFVLWMRCFAICPRVSFCPWIYNIFIWKTCELMALRYQISIFIMSKFRINKGEHKLWDRDTGWDFSWEYKIKNCICLQNSKIPEWFQRTNGLCVSACVCIIVPINKQNAHKKYSP